MTCCAAFPSTLKCLITTYFIVNLLSHVLCNTRRRQRSTPAAISTLLLCISGRPHQPHGSLNTRPAGCAHPRTKQPRSDGRPSEHAILGRLTTPTTTVATPRHTPHHSSPSSPANVAACRATVCPHRSSLPALPSRSGSCPGSSVFPVGVRGRLSCQPSHGTTGLLTYLLTYLLT